MDKNYKLVYQSGHTSTWCNGESHRTTHRGWVEQPMEYGYEMPEGLSERSQVYECNCEMFKEDNESQ